MRFGVPDSSDDEDFVDIDSGYSSDDFEQYNQRRTRPSSPWTTLGKSIREAFDTSDDEFVVSGFVGAGELDSEDEIDGLSFDEESLDGDGWGLIGAVKLKGSDDEVRSGKIIPNQTPEAHPAKQVNRKVSFDPKIPRQNSNKTGPSAWARRTGEPSLKEVLSERPSEFEDWIKETEEEAWRDGQKMSNTRRVQLREIKMNARVAIQNERARQSARETEEIQTMLRGLVVQEEDEKRRREQEFAERERKLWADIDAAIAETIRQAEQARLVAQALERKQKAEEVARKAAAEKILEAKRLEAEKAAREKTEKEQADRQAREAAEREMAEAAAREEAKAREKEVGDLTRNEWQKWVEKQRWMKTEVIEIVKADNTLRSSLRVGMRLITRGIGQVVNTQESIIRVSDDISKILISQLPYPPTISQPILLSQPPPVSYSYLLSHLSKALIKQAESEVNAKPAAAFPLARIVVSLFLRGHAALGEVLFARLVKKAPWVIPFYPGREQGQSKEEYEKSTGRGSDESTTDYISRQAGILTLYFAILQTPLSSLSPNPTPSPAELAILIAAPFRLPQAWSWMANILKGKLPGLKPTAHLLTVWIDIVGSEVTRVFGGRQVGKVIEAMGREGLGVGGNGQIKGDSEATRQRLWLRIENWGREGPKPHPARIWG